MRKKEEEQSAKVIRCGLGIVLGGILALAVSALFLLAASVAISAGVIGENLTYQMVVVSCVLGGFAGGLLAIGRCGAAPLLVGLAAGGVFFLLLLTIGTLSFSSVSVEEGGIGLLCGCLCGGAAAGLLRGAPAKGRSRKKRRK